MPWCPECGTEYRKGFTVCKDCRVPLTDSRPENKKDFPDPEMVRETLLTIVPDELEFTRIESLMAEAGIPVLKKHHGSGEYLELYMGGTPYGIEIYVPHGAYSRAKALLSGDESVLGDGGVILDAHEEQELHRYMNAVNQDIYLKKKAVATMILLSMGAGVVWTVYSIVKELF